MLEVIRSIWYWIITFLDYLLREDKPLQEEQDMGIDKNFYNEYFHFSRRHFLCQTASQPHIATFCSSSSQRVVAVLRSLTVARPLGQTNTFQISRN